MYTTEVHTLTDYTDLCFAILAARKCISVNDSGYG